MNYCIDGIAASCYGPEDPSLHFDRLNSGIMQFGCCGRSRIHQQKTVKAAVICLPHGGGHADVRGHSTQDQISDTANPQEMFKLGVGKCSSTWLINDSLVGQRFQLWNNIVSRLSADQESSKRARVANAELTRVVA